MKVRLLSALFLLMGVALVVFVLPTAQPAFADEGAEESPSDSAPPLVSHIGGRTLFLPLVVQAFPITCNKGEYKAEYFNNPNLGGVPVLVRCESSIDYRWGTGNPAPGVNSDRFSVRWTGRFDFQSDSYTFTTMTNDGMRAWLDGELILNEWRDQAEQSYQVTRNVSAGEHEVKVEYYDTLDTAIAQFGWRVAECALGQYRAEYYNNRTLSGAPVFSRCEDSINEDWGYNGPGNGVGNDDFSVRWTGRFYFADDEYTFVARTDDGMRIWLDNTLILDQWRDQVETEYRVTRSVSEGEHQIRVEYYEGVGEAVADVRWSANCPTGEFRANYYNNRDMSGNPIFSRCESRIQHNWGSGGPDHGVGNDEFSVSWNGRFTFTGGTYTFIARTDDGMRIWLDGVQILDQWRDQTATEYRVVRTVAAGEHEVRVEYYEGVGDAVAEVRWERNCPTGQYYAQYFNNTTLSGSPTFTRCEGPIDYTWGMGGPGNGVGNDGFSVRWTGRFSFAGGSYRFVARTDDGMRIWLDGTRILDEWRVQSVREYQVVRTVSAGEHEVQVEYFESTGDAAARVSWSRIQ